MEKKKIWFIVGGVLVLILLVYLIFFRSKNEFEGYWCRYDESASIIILMNRDFTENDKVKIENYLNNLNNLSSSPIFYTREEYAQKMGEDANSMNIYDNFYVSFDSFDSIGTYVEDLNKMSGVYKAEQTNVKNDMSLYNIKKHGKYTFADIPDAKENELLTGKYKIEEGVIVFYPDDDEIGERLLYIKNGHLCADADCNKIYSQTDASCKAK